MILISGKLRKRSEGGETLSGFIENVSQYYDLGGTIPKKGRSIIYSLDPIVQDP